MSYGQLDPEWLARAMAAANGSGQGTMDRRPSTIDPRELDRVVPTAPPINDPRMFRQPSHQMPLPPNHAQQGMHNLPGHPGNAQNPAGLLEMLLGIARR